MHKRKVGILISGRGSNMTALIEAAKDPAYPAEIVTVVSNRPDAAGLARAEAEGIAAQAFDHKAFAGREAFERALDAHLRAAGVEIVCLAGFLRRLTPWFVNAWRDRMINIHPALLPSFKGLHTHEAALETGVKLHGATVHFVRAEVDAGPIIIQGAVPVLDDDTADSLAARVLTVEHRIFPQALALLASGKARIDAERVVLTEGEADGAGFLVAPSI